MGAIPERLGWLESEAETCFSFVMEDDLSLSPNLMSVLTLLAMKILSGTEILDSKSALMVEMQPVKSFPLLAALTAAIPVSREKWSGILLPSGEAQPSVVDPPQNKT